MEGLFARQSLHRSDSYSGALPCPARPASRIHPFLYHLQPLNITFPPLFSLPTIHSPPSRPLRPLKRPLNLDLRPELLLDVLPPHLVGLARLDLLRDRESGLLLRQVDDAGARARVQHALLDLGGAGAGVDEDYGGAGGGVVGVSEEGEARLGGGEGRGEGGEGRGGCGGQLDGLGGRVDFLEE